MFPRKQYTYREGSALTPDVSSDGVTLIVSCMNDMPLGTFAYPYRTEAMFEGEDYEDIFAILTSKGWRFFQADKTGGPIFKMWKHSISIISGGSNRLYNKRIAYHIDENSECGPIFLSGMTLGTEGDDLKRQYISCNVLPFASAFYDYKGIPASDDARKYILCSSDDRYNDQVNLPWQYRLTLVPQDDKCVLSSSSDILKAITSEKGYVNKVFSKEEASRNIGYIFKSQNSTLHTSWGEYAEQYPKHDGYTYRYFEIDGGDADDRMMIGSTEDRIAIYYKDSATNYSKIADLLVHADEEGSSIDTVLRFNNRYLFRAIYNNSIANKVKLQIGELIRQDDVVVFLFDSCVDDPERAAIRDLLLQKYNRTVVTNGGTPSDVLLCYKPDLDIMSDNDDLRTQILNQCKIAK